MTSSTAEQWPFPVAGPLPEVVDHIVIGAGAAGCVVAARLSEPGSTAQVPWWC